jgi:hypothetical protein
VPPKYKQPAHAAPRLFAQFAAVCVRMEFGAARATMQREILRDVFMQETN